MHAAKVLSTPLYVVIIISIIIKNNNNNNTINTQS